LIQKKFIAAWAKVSIKRKVSSPKSVGPISEQTPFQNHSILAKFRHLSEPIDIVSRQHLGQPASSDD
jgi:hypothetical protein